MDIARRFTVALAAVALCPALAGAAAAVGAAAQTTPAPKVVASGTIGWPGDDSGPSGTSAQDASPIGWPGDDALSS